MDADSFVASEKEALEEQHVDIEFAQKNAPKEESWKDAPVSQPQASLAQ